MALPVLAQIYALSAGIGCLTVLISALTGAMHHGAGAHGHGHGHAGHIGHGHTGGHGHSQIGHGHGHAHSAGHVHGHAEGHGHGHGHGHDAGSDGGDQRASAGVMRVNKQHVAVKEDEPGLGIMLLTWLNPNTIAAFATWFGSIGLVLWRGFSLPLLFTLPFAIIGGAMGAKFMLAFVGFIGSRMYQSHTFTQQDVIGLQAEVTVPVTNQGMGEVVYVIGGGRHTTSARPNKPEINLARGAKAIICDMRDDVAYIEPWVDIDDDNFALPPPPGDPQT